MSSNKIVLSVGAALAAGGLLLGGSALANAADGTSPAPVASTAGGYDGGRGGGSADTPVTGTEATKVTAAVKAKDSAVTVTSVRKDPDGSYDALGTKSGTQVFYDVSKDLKTITERTGGPGRPGGGHGGGSADTPVTGTEAAKVTAAVKAKDSAVTVTSVRKDPDGSYDVLGTKSGTQVFYEVSKDLKTITERTGGPGGGPGQSDAAPSTSSTSTT